MRRHGLSNINAIIIETHFYKKLIVNFCCQSIKELVMNNCTICGGSGRNLEPGEYPCYICSGTGHKPDVDTNPITSWTGYKSYTNPAMSWSGYKPGVSTITSCINCSGAGKITENRYNLCHHCGGTGRQ